jgi:hypothetical protein
MTNDRPAEPRDVKEIDIERLAAMLEGNVSEAERRQLLAKLAASDSAVTAFADAAAIHASETADNRPLPFRLRNQTRIALVASITLVVAIGGVLTRRGDGGLPSVEQIARSGPTNEVLDPLELWDTKRGANMPTGSTARGIRLGALLLDLHVRAFSSDSTAADAAFRIAAYLSEIPGAGSVATEFRRVGVSSISAAALVAPSGNAEQLLGEQIVRAGAWLQAARLAALRRDTDFFANDQARTALKYLGSRADEWSIRTLLDDVQVQLRGANPSWETLHANLTRLLSQVGR